MCGIAAIIGQNQTDSRLEISLMSEIISHRGPDGDGVFVEDNIALGHRRLSIVDLSELGSQPLTYQDRYVIVYNGEVYNHIELRLELEKMGYNFSSHTDTEVIVAAYAAWGEQCLERFNGMWSFVLLDRKEQVVFCARDRFGVKPFYYWVSPKGALAVASEIKQFTVLKGWQPQINKVRALEFLKWGVLDHTHETLFKDVFQLRGGEKLTFRLKNTLFSSDSIRTSIKRWYNLQSTKFAEGVEIESNKFRELLGDSIRLRLRADVSVGSCLSGGLDSSSIVCVMNEHLLKISSPHKQKTFSACAEHKKYDESGFIEQVVSATKVEPHYVFPRVSDLFSDLDKITWHQDEPFGSTSIFAQWNVFKLASTSGVKVMLDGQGADEQLAGYHIFFGAYWAQLFRNLKWRQLFRELRAARRIHGYSFMRIVKSILVNIFPGSFVAAIRRLFSKLGSEPIWYNKRSFEVRNDGRLSALSDGTNISSMSKKQILQTSLPMLLHWEDRDSMAHGIEARVPFLDYRLVEKSLSLPDSYKIENGVTKSILRRAMSDLLPEGVRSRMDKMGFVTPEEIWMKSEASNEFREKLKESILVSRGLINDSILVMFDEMLQGKRPFDFLYWRVISFGSWLKVFKVEV